jgi:hypothetical protein
MSGIPRQLIRDLWRAAAKGFDQAGDELAAQRCRATAKLWTGRQVRPLYEKRRSERRRALIGEFRHREAMRARASKP